MHSFLSLELCGSLNTQTHRMKKEEKKKTATQAQNIHKTSQNMSQFIKTVVNSITFSVSTDQPTPKHRHCMDNICQQDRGRNSACTHSGVAGQLATNVLTRRLRCRPAAETGRFSGRGRNLQIQKDIEKNSKKQKQTKKALLSFTFSLLHYKLL